MKKKLLTIFTTIFIIIYFFSFSISVTASFKPLYYFSIDFLNIEENSELSRKEIEDNYNYLVYYISQKNDYSFSLPTLSFSEKGEIHFKEVKHTLKIIYSIVFVSLLGAIICIYLNNKSNNLKYLKYSSIGLVFIPIPFLIPTLINFDGFFDFMHAVIFNNDYWLFSPSTDPIIKILPQEFFMFCVVMILSLILFCSLLLWVTYLFKVKKNKEQRTN